MHSFVHVLPAIANVAFDEGGNRTLSAADIAGRSRWDHDHQLVVKPQIIANEASKPCRWYACGNQAGCGRLLAIFPMRIRPVRFRVGAESDPRKQRLVAGSLFYRQLSIRSGRTVASEADVHDPRFASDRSSFISGRLEATEFAHGEHGGRHAGKRGTHDTLQRQPAWPGLRLHVHALDDAYEQLGRRRWSPCGISPSACARTRHRRRRCRGCPDSGAALGTASRCPCPSRRSRCRCCGIRGWMAIPRIAGCAGACATHAARRAASLQGQMLPSHEFQCHLRSFIRWGTPWLEHAKRRAQ